MLTGDMTLYGFAVAKEILRCETEHVQSFLREPLKTAEIMWEEAFLDEMKLLLEAELMPQDRKSNDPFLTAYLEAVEHKRFDRI